MHAPNEWMMLFSATEEKENEFSHNYDEYTFTP
jgi:hypothetical protein